MILIDEPKQYAGRPGIMRGHAFTSSHMISDQEGPAGTRELQAMATLLGLKPAWLQHAGTHREHFDVMNGVYARAVAAGAVPTPAMALIDVMIGKTWTNSDYVRRIMEEMQKVGFYDAEVESRLNQSTRAVLRECWRKRKLWIDTIANTQGELPGISQETQRI